MKQYLDTGVYLSPSCATAQLLAAGKTAEAAKSFKATTQAFEKTYPNKEDRNWFMAVSLGKIPLHGVREVKNFQMDSVSLVMGENGQPEIGIRGHGEIQ